jgi:hypothetical protein
MKITATGWNRDMGPTVIGDIDLAEIKSTDDHSATFSFNGVGFYRTFLRKADIYWGKSLKLTGNYKVRVEFSPADVRQLFGVVYGWLLTADLVEEYGFVVYDDLKKKILREIKVADFLRSEGVELADVTLGDLIELKAKRPAKGDKAAGG